MIDAQGKGGRWEPVGMTAIYKVLALDLEGWLTHGEKMRKL